MTNNSTLHCTLLRLAGSVACAALIGAAAPAGSMPKQAGMGKVHRIAKRTPFQQYVIRLREQALANNDMHQALRLTREAIQSGALTDSSIGTKFSLGGGYERSLLHMLAKTRDARPVIEHILEAFPAAGTARPRMKRLIASVFSVAVEAGIADNVAALISRTNPEKKHRSGRVELGFAMSEYPVHLAARSCSAPTARVLRENQVSFGRNDSNGRSPLYYALRSRRSWYIDVGGHEGVVAEILASGVTPQLDDVPGDLTLPLFDLLRRGGFDLRQRGEGGRDLLHLAVQSRNLPLASHLLDQCDADVNSLDDQQLTPIVRAVRNAEGGGPSGSEVVEALVRRGADVKRKYAALHGDQVIHVAAQHLLTAKAFQSLMEKGAKINGRGQGRMTPLHRAAETYNPAIIKMVLRFGGSRTLTDVDGDTPLLRSLRHYPQWKGKHRTSVQTGEVAWHSEVLDTLDLLTGPVGEALQLPSEEGFYPHHLAVVAFPAALPLFLKRGAQVDAKAKNSLKATALHLAAQADSLVSAQFLVKNGANKAIADGEGRRPFDLIREDSANPSIFAKLLE